MIKISVVLTTYNRANLLKEALPPLFKQSLSKKFFEVLVVDDGSTDNTAEIVKEFMKKHKNLRYFRQKHSGLSAGRNFGISKARGEIIAFTDDDCRVDKNWLQEILKAFARDKKVVGVEGRVETRKEKPLLSSAPENLDGGKFIGCNSAYKKRLLEELDGYDERFFAIRDDSDIAFRMLTQGKIVFAKNAVVVHPPLKVGLLHFLKRLKYIQSDLLLQRKHPALFSQYIGNPFFRHSLQSCFAWVVALLFVYSLSFSPYVAVLCPALYLAFRYFRNIRGKKATFFDSLGFVFVIFLRDLAYPFVFAFYWIKAEF